MIIDFLHLGQLMTYRRFNVLGVSVPRVSIEMVEIEQYNGRITLPGRHTYEPVEITFGLVQDDPCSIDEPTSTLFRLLEDQMEGQREGLAPKFICIVPDLYYTMHNCYVPSLEVDGLDATEYRMVKVKVLYDTITVHG